MKVRTRLSIAVALAAALGASSWVFFRKTFVEFDWVCTLNEGRTFYRPEACVFFHSQRQMDDYFAMNAETRGMREQLPADLVFDFGVFSL